MLRGTPTLKTLSIDSSARVACPDPGLDLSFTDSRSWALASEGGACIVELMYVNSFLKLILKDLYGNSIKVF